MAPAAPGRRMLVTGGGGYLGSVLVPQLLAEGWRVRVLDRFFFGRHRLPDDPTLETVTADLRALSPSHLDGCDAVVELAAISNDPSGEAFAEATWAINHRARAACARMAADRGLRYVLASSCSVYGFRPEGEPCDEAAPIAPQTTYARANAAAEAEVLPLPGTIVLRFATLFGTSPRMRYDLAVNAMTEQAMRTGRLPLMRDGTQWRPFLHVADAAAAIRFVLQHEASGLLNVVGENVQLRDLADRVADLSPQRVTIEWYGDSDRRSYRVDAAAIAALGFVPSCDLDDGIREIATAAIPRTADTITLDWYRSLSDGPSTLHAS